MARFSNMWRYLFMVTVVVDLCIQIVVLVIRGGIVCHRSRSGVSRSASIGIIGYKCDGAVVLGGSVSLLVGMSVGEHMFVLLPKASLQNSCNSGCITARAWRGWSLGRFI